MTTNSEYFRFALGKIGILAEGEAVSAEQGADMLVILNDMMDGLLGEGIDIGFSPQSSTTDEPDFQEGYKEAIKCMLAIKAAAHFEVSLSAISQEVIVAADKGYKRMQREAMYRNATPRDFNNTPFSRGGNYNIQTG
jgi:microcystin degradation protein MlrC